MTGETTQDHWAGYSSIIWKKEFSIRGKGSGPKFNWMFFVTNAQIVFESFHAQNLDFQKFPHKCVTHAILSFEKDWMICNIMEEITRNRHDLELSETSIEVFPQSSWQFGHS